MSIHSIEAKVQQIKSEFLSAAASTKTEPSPTAVEKLRLNFLGRKGHLPKLMEGLREISNEERPVAGKLINDLRQYIEQEMTELTAGANDWQLEQQLNLAPLDISLPVDNDYEQGSLHPVTLMRNDLSKVFHHLGFTIYDGPEVDSDFYNFAALNFPEHHPARDMQDTFFVRGYPKTVLRTHTSNIQIHAMLKEKPPLRLVSMGRTYRCDSDATHTPMFHQVEGFVVDHNISMADLAGVLDAFISGVFGSSVKTRLRPSYFPFVEPGAEFDMQCVACQGKGCHVCKNSGWLEIGGCGMIHPNVFEAVDYDSEKYTGFAFGFGIDRMAMLRYNIKDLRQMFEGARSFLQQFPIY